jgi:acetyl-CoA carboxylase carboxyl transferase subunit alpha
MSKDEVLNHRKNKFLSIGRSKGFISQSVDDDSLHMKQNPVDVLKVKIVKNKNQLIIVAIVLTLIASFFYLL